MSRHVRRPPGPKGLPLLGSAPQITRNPLAFYRDMSQKYGPISFARLGPVPFYLIGDSALIEQFLVGDYKHCVKDAITRTLDGLIGQGLLTSEGELWRRQRKLAAPAFAAKRVSSYADVMVSCADRVFASYRDGEVRDFHNDIMTLTLEIVGKTILGVNTREESEAIARVLHVTFDYFEELLYSWRRLLPKKLPTPSRLRFLRGKAELDAIVRELVARSRARGENEEAADHLLGRLSRARGENGEVMSERQLHDEALTMLLAGHETTALGLMYATLLLSQNPAAATRLRAEVDRVVGSRAITAADLPELKYLDACARETLRLYPPAYAFGREVIEEFELGGYVLPVGSQIVVSPYGIQRDVRNFPEPDAFRPERWLDGSTHGLPRFAYLPFGGGPRVCIGNHFAMMELALVLATAVQHVELTVLPGYDLALAPSITLRARDGLPVRVKRRTPRRVPVEADAAVAED